MKIEDHQGQLSGDFFAVLLYDQLSHGSDGFHMINGLSFLLEVEEPNVEAQKKIEEKKKVKRLLARRHPRHLHQQRERQ